MTAEETPVTEKKPHPIGTMQPSAADMQRMLVTLAWSLRENAGECERHLDSDEESVGFSRVTSPGQLHSMANTCGRLSETVGVNETAVQEAAMFFSAAAGHFGAADAHLTTHLTYTALVEDHSDIQGRPTDKHLSGLYDDERTFAARAMRLGRQLAHRGLSKLVEAWPRSFETETEA
jgi:hypothetical protein